MTVKQCETLIHKYRNRIESLSSVTVPPTDPGYANHLRECALANRLLSEYTARLRKLTS